MHKAAPLILAQTLVHITPREKSAGLLGPVCLLTADPVPVGQMPTQVQQGIGIAGQGIHLGQLAQHIASGHCRKLFRVASQNQFGACVSGPLQQLLHIVKPGHAGFIDKDHRVAVQILFARCQIK